MQKEILKGGIDLMILSLISHEDQYGYELAKKIKKYSNDLYEIGEGTLYPALKRLETSSCIESYWQEMGSGGRRKYYRVTPTGKEVLEKKIDDWSVLNRLILACYNGGTPQ